MQVIKKRFSLFVFFCCIAGFAWLYISEYFHFAEGKNTKFSTCVFKNITGFPCPACGSTRSMLRLLHGDIRGSVFLNPLGDLLLILMIASLLLLVYDFIFKKELFISLYNKAESILKRKIIFIPLIVLLLINWAWNIYKHV